MSGYNPSFGRSMTEEEYCNEWIKSSEAYGRGGYYSWLCQRLEPIGDVLEIGCGAGNSTISLLKNANTVTSVDVNSSCVTHARTLVSREEGHEKCEIRQLDVFSDDVQEMLSGKIFNTVTLWMPGAANNIISKVMDVSVERISAGDLAKYREEIIIKSSNVAYECLGEGGRFQISLRSAIPWNEKDKYRSEFALEHKALCGDRFRCEKEDVFFTKLGSEMGASSIGHVVNAPKLPSGYSLVLSSIIMNKS